MEELDEQHVKLKYNYEVLTKNEIRFAKNNEIMQKYPNYQVNDYR